MVEKPTNADAPLLRRSTRIVVGAVLGLGAGLALFVLWPRGAPPASSATVVPAGSREPPAAIEKPEPTPTHSTASAALRVRASAPVPVAPLPPIDLFSSDAPELIREAHRVTADGGLLALGRMKDLYQMGKDHPGDARPHLVMGEDAMNRGWEAFAVDHYSRAQREDPRARQDPRMLKDLVAIAARKANGAAAAAAITTIYGASAVTAVEQALAAAGDKGDNDTVERLSDLSQKLSSTPTP